MMTPNQTVREIALENPASVRVFEAFGIDYCCGGRKPLAEACAAKSLPIEKVLDALESASTTLAGDAEDWNGRTLAALAAHIVDTHHAYVRKELPRLEALAEKVVRRHGDTQEELAQIQSRVVQLAEELLQHCAKEELVLFPYIAKLERAIEEGTPLPHGCFGSVSNPIAMMTQEHDAAGTLLSDIHQLSNGFTPPLGACPTYHAFYNGLRDFQQDLHQHIHLENNILFPRAVEKEISVS